MNDPRPRALLIYGAEKEIAPDVVTTEATKEKTQNERANDLTSNKSLRAPDKYAALPKAMREAKRWLVWKLLPSETPGGKARKVPFYADGGKRGYGVDLDSPEDVARLATFDAARARQDRGGYAGLGFALGPDGDGCWQGVDFDHVASHPELTDLIELAQPQGSYLELSVSGNGWHLIGYGKRFDALGSNSSGIEAYSGGRYFTVTGQAGSLFGDRLGDLSAWVRDELVPLHGAYERERKQSQGPAERDDLGRMVTLDAVTDETVAEVRSAMSVFTEQDADSYHFWVDCGLALKSLAQAGFEGEALAMWHEFSALSAKYDHDEAQRKWDRDLNEPTRITYLSIFKWASAPSRGWVNPKSAEALKANATAATRLDRTDAGNVAIMATLAQGNLRFVPEYKIWLWWSGERWERDQYGNYCVAAALQVAEHYHQKAAEIRKQAKTATLDDKEAKNIEKAAASMEAWASRCRNKSSIDNMLDLAKRDERFTLPADKLDRDPWLFGVDNGVVDLRTGTLRPAGRDDLVTKRSPVRFDPEAQAPRWLQFIDEITAEADTVKNCTHRPALAAYLQRALGYAMTGSTAEHKMFMAIGEGSNGKNVLLDLLQWILGDYCQNIASEALMASRHDADAERATPSARKLAGARVAISSESKDGQRLDVALVKRHTGGGFMTARALHENAFTFEITHKLWLMTNHKPALDHMDEAMRGRLHMIPFDMRWNRPGHPERDPNLPDGDKALPEKLKAEAEGVLAWLVAGALAYVREGLEPPPEVVRMTRAYFKDQDPLGLWLDTCKPCDVSVGGKASDLFDSYREWCIEEGFGIESSGNQTSFSNKLKARGVAGQRTKDGKRYGLRAAEPAEPAEPAEKSALV